MRISRAKTIFANGLVPAAVAAAGMQAVVMPPTAVYASTHVSVSVSESAPASTSESSEAAWTPAFVVIPPGERAVQVHATIAGRGPVRAEITGTAGYRGYSVALVRIAPFALGSPPAPVVLQVDTAPARRELQPLVRLRPDMVQSQRASADVRALVANDADVDRFAPSALQMSSIHPAVRADRPRGFQPTSDPSLDGSGVRYLIVTTEALVPSFQILADWKTRRGVPTAIRSIEWIESRTRHGVDRAETLRNFLVEAYQLWGVEYVLLGGDTDLLPARFAYSNVFGGGTAPADMYFACLDGTWNADGDSKWGEGGLGAVPSEADILPELAVARAPVNDATQTVNFVLRVVGYETPLFADYQTRAAFMTEVLVPANWDSGQSISYNGAPTTELIISQSLPPAFTSDRLYDTYWQYPGSEKLLRTSSVAAMNSGVGIVNHLGHGFRYTMSCGNGSLVNADADALTNGGRTFVMCMANCAAVSFDYNCLAERFLLNPGGGAAAVIGAARSVSASLVTVYDRAFFRQLFEQGHVHVADLLNALRLERASLAELDGGDRWIQFSLNALADAEMSVFTGAVRFADVAHAPSVPVGPSTLAVTVQVGGVAVTGATVCAMKGNEVYSTAITNVAGQVQLPMMPATPGAIAVTVSGANLAQHVDSVQVVAAAGPAVALGGFSVDDDAVAPSAGNGDAAIDAGETIELTLAVVNHGGALADSVSAALSSGDPRVTVLQPDAFAGAVGPGATALAAPACVVQLAGSIPDGTTFDLPVHYTDRTGATWDDRVHLLVGAPRTEIVRVEAVHDIDPLHVFVNVSLKNYGSGQQPALAGTLTCSDPSVTIVSGSALAGPLAALGGGDAAPRFELQTPTPGVPPVELTFADAYGRTVDLHCDLKPPAAPAAPVADLAWAPGTVRLTWTPSTASDRLGYHVFRSSAAPATPAAATFDQLTPDVIHHADFYDTGVAANSHYDYYVVAVDSSCQWSAASPVVGVNTTAASLAGWPLDMIDPTASSEAVGDIDGDGSPEVVTGDLGVYAWHANGQEVRDGDANATTDGVFSPLVGTMNASVALAEIDNQPGLEIVGASWATNRIYAWNNHGDVLPGWPREPFHGGNQGYWASPAVADLDGDGVPEIVAISKDGNLYAWHANGTGILPGYPDGFVRTVGAWTQTTPALADLAGNGQREIIVSGALAQVFVIRPDGSDFPGWPQSLYALGKGSPAVGDVDGDGDLEIVLTSESDHMYVFNADGTLLPGWPQIIAGDSPDLGPSPALGDLDGDGKLEIVVCSVKNPFTFSKIYVLDSTGNILFTKQLETNSQSSPILADLDGDGGIDIVHGGEAGVLHAWNLAGNELPGFPIPVGDYIRATPQYCDLDGDGKGDLVLAGWNKKVYAWKMTGAYRPERAPWPMFHGNVARTGFLPGNFPTATLEVPVARRLRAEWAPNPFNPSVTLQLTVPQERQPLGTAGLVAVRVEVFDARGRLVRRLFDAALPPGLARLTWDGRNDAGARLGSGVYLYRVRAGTQATSGKLGLVR